MDLRLLAPDSPEAVLIALHPDRKKKTKNNFSHIRPLDYLLVTLVEENEENCVYGLWTKQTIEKGGNRLWLNCE